MGAYLGFSKIPNYFIENLELKDVITEIAEDYSKEISEVSDVEDKYWESNMFI